jgi:hypothetical protein
MTPSMPPDRTVRSSFMMYTPARAIWLYTPPTMLHTAIRVTQEQAGRKDGAEQKFGSLGKR